MTHQPNYQSTPTAPTGTAFWIGLALRCLGFLLLLWAVYTVLAGVTGSVAFFFAAGPFASSPFTSTLQLVFTSALIALPRALIGIGLIYFCDFIVDVLLPHRASR